MYDVITVGSSTIDVFANVESELIKIKTVTHEEELIAYPSGSKILIKNLDFLTGGGGTNTAVVLSKLGLKVAYLGKIGTGSNSGLIVKRLKKDNIAFMGVQSKKYHSGYSIILDSLEGDRTILAYKGANNYLEYKELNLKKLKTKWFYFSSMIGKSYETLEKLAEYGVKNNIKIAFNPSNYLAEKGFSFLKKLLSNVTLLILNKEEANLLAGKGEIKDLIKRISEFGPKLVIITDGKRGAYTIENNKLLHVHTLGNKPVETTGAGDVFASTVLAGLIKGKKVKECLRLSAINSSFAIMEKGAKRGLLNYEKLNSILRKNPPKIDQKKV